MPRFTRRRALRDGAGVVMVGLAGCSGDDSDTSSGGDESTPSGDGGESDTSSGGDESTPSGDGGESDTSSGGDESTPSGDGETSGDVSRSLVVGESYTNPIGSSLTVTDIELQDTVEAQRRFGGEGLYQKEPQDGKQWAVATLEVTNDSGQTQYLTPPMEISARANGTEYSSTAIKNDQDTYEAAEVQDGESRVGWLAYSVPAELTLADIEVVHSNSVDGESWTVTWSDS
jgi:hypothetical protein